MNKNILCISKYASLPQYGNMCRSFYLTREFLRQGNNATLITSDANHSSKFPETEKKYNFEVVDDVPVWWIKTKKYIKTASVSRVLSWFDFERRLFGFDLSQISQPDVVIISSLSIFTILYGIHIKRKFNAKLLFEIRDIWPLTMTEEAGFSKRHPLVILIGWLERLGYKKADMIVGTMPKLDLHIRNILGYERPFFCSPLGFSEEMRRDEKKHYDTDSFNDKIPKNKFIVGYAGSMGISNNLQPFINTIKLLQDNQNIHFVLAGDGDLKQHFDHILKDCRNVTFLGRLPQQKIPELLDKVDLAYLSVYKSRVWDYGQSMNKVVEYMLASKPILASYSGYPSMINEADCGQFIDTDNPLLLKDAILSYASYSKNDLFKIGNKGKDWILKNRSYKLLAEKYLDQIHLLF